MSGILPNNGVPPGQTQNAVADVPMAPGCDALFYPPRCNPRLDPYQANAVISEILNVVDAAGNTYECTQLDNLALAIQAMSRLHVISVSREVGNGGNLALPVTVSIAESPIETGSINLPNSSDEAIHCNLTMTLHTNVSRSSGNERYNISFRLFSDVALSQSLGFTHVQIVGTGGGGSSNSIDVYPASTFGLDIPPGGLTIYYQFSGSANNAGNLANLTFGRISVFGVGTPSGSTIDT